MGDNKIKESVCFGEWSVPLICNHANFYFFGPIQYLVTLVIYTNKASKRLTTLNFDYYIITFWKC